MEEINTTGLQVTETIKANTLSGLKWLKFLTVLTVVGLGICVLAGICMLTSGNMVAAFGGNAALCTMMGILYIVIVGIYVYPLKRTFDFIRDTREAFANNSQVCLEASAEAFKSVLKYIGIVTIAMLVIYGIALIVTVIAAAAAATVGGF